MEVGRREALKALGIPVRGALSLRFDPVARRWVSVWAEAQQAPRSTTDRRSTARSISMTRRVRLSPPTRGTSYTARRRPSCGPDRSRTSSGWSSIVAGMQSKWTVRGQAHTMFGQPLSDGLVIENVSLNAIRLHRSEWRGCRDWRGGELGPADLERQYQGMPGASSGNEAVVSRQHISRQARESFGKFEAGGRRNGGGQRSLSTRWPR